MSTCPARTERPGPDVAPRRGGWTGAWRFALAAMLAATLAASGARAAPAPAFGWDDVVELARVRAQQPAAAAPALPEWLVRLPPAQWDQIRPDPRRVLGGAPDARFSAQLHHPGGLYQRGVRVHRIGTGGAPAAIPFDSGAFFYGADTTRGPVTPDIGYAGVTIAWQPAGGEARPVAQFLGGSFLRAGAPDPGGGTRGRAATLDVGLPGGEEFPVFTDLYLDLGAPDAAASVVYALVESTRLAGAYRFEITPGEDHTQTAVTAVLHAREAVEKVGIGALDSLYYYGEERARPPGEWRPEVHAADVLLMRGPGQVFVARTLTNPGQLAMEEFAPPRPLPYGLLQRDRRFDHYQDLDQELEARPNAWLTPGEGFPDGTLELLELPLGDPFNHNVLAHWVVDTPPAPDRPLRYAYTITWGRAEPLPDTLGRVAAVRSAAVTQPQPVLIAQLDFTGPAPAAGDAPVRAQGLVLEGGRIVAHALAHDPETGLWRLTLRVAPEGRRPVVLEARLVQDGRARTETWHGVFGPERLP